MVYITNTKTIAFQIMNKTLEFNDLYHSCAPKVHRLCLGYASGDNDLANEWLQETFVKVWMHKHQFKNTSSIETWIYRIAVNVCLGDIRKSKPRYSINEEILSRQNQNDYDYDFEKDKKISKMYDCIAQLNNQNKTLILLELENLPQIKIAEATGLAHGTLRTRLSRIRKSLLKCILNETR